MSPNLSMNKTKVLASVDFQKKGREKILFAKKHAEISSFLMVFIL